MDCYRTTSKIRYHVSNSNSPIRIFCTFAICTSFCGIEAGCRSVDCGWYTYRFAKTRVDETQPAIVEKSKANAESQATSKNSYLMEDSTVNPTVDPTVDSMDVPSENATHSQIGSHVSTEGDSLHLVGYAQAADDRNASIEIASSPMILISGDSQKLSEASPSPSDDSAASQGGGNNGGKRVENEDSKSNFFDLPNEFPGGDAVPLKLPRMDTGASVVERRSVVDKLFADLPVPISNPVPHEVDGRLITLTELQDLALANNPALQQAVARVEAARGTMIQVGLYPNPTLGYEGDTIGTADTNGYNGGFLTQQLITANKLGLAQSSAMMEMRAAEYDLRTTRIQIASNVRRLYFSILVEQEKIRLYRSIQLLSEEVYEAQRTLVAGGESAVYEPLQLRVLAVLASNNVLTAKNSLAAYWRQVAAATGVPELPPCEASGSIEMQVPQIELQQAIDQMLSRNSDLTAARLRISSKQYNLRLQQVTPIPDVTVYSALQRDSTSSLTPNRTTFNMQVSVPVPVFNRNQGNVTNARANLVDADRNYAVVSNQLQADLADAYNRYTTGQTIVNNYRNVILPDQVRVYRATYSRFRIAGQEVDFAQIIVTQQTLAQAVANYLDAVAGQWQATVDVARLLQVDDLFTMDLAQSTEIQQ